MNAGLPRLAHVTRQNSSPFSTFKGKDSMVNTSTKPIESTMLKKRATKTKSDFEPETTTCDAQVNFIIKNLMSFQGNIRLSLHSSALT